MALIHSAFRMILFQWFCLKRFYTVNKVSRWWQQFSEHYKWMHTSFFKKKSHSWQSMSEQKISRETKEDCFQVHIWRKESMYLSRTEEHAGFLFFNWSSLEPVSLFVDLAAQSSWGKNFSQRGDQEPKGYSERTPEVLLEENLLAGQPSLQHSTNLRKEFSQGGHFERPLEVMRYHSSPGQFHPYWEAVLAIILMLLHCCFLCCQQLSKLHVPLYKVKQMEFAFLVYRWCYSFYNTLSFRFPIEKAAFKLLFFPCSLLRSPDGMLCRYLKNGAPPTESYFAAGFQSKCEDLL